MPATTHETFHAPALLRRDSDSSCGRLHHGDPECEPQDVCKPETPLLGVLQPRPLLPSRERMRRGVDALRPLQRIESLRVRASLARTQSTTAYVLDLFYHHAPLSRIPVHGVFAPTQDTTDRGNALRPSETLEFAYEEVLQLSHGAYELTRLSHTTASCAFCRPVIFYNTTSSIKPCWNSHWFKSHRQVAEMLTRYLQEMLRLAVTTPVGGGAICRGHERVARLLQRFLERSSPSARASI